MKIKCLFGVTLILFGIYAVVISAQEKEKNKKDEPLSHEARIELIRQVSSEFARVIKTIPSLEKGFRIKVGEPLDEKELAKALANSLFRTEAGALVQITKLEFKKKEIVVELNFGGKVRKSWRDRVQVEVGGLPTIQRTDDAAGEQPPAPGSILILDFGRPLPNMTPDELKQYLSALLDFSKQRSASQNWIDTIPPEFKKAIGEKRVELGMSKEMVLAAKGHDYRNNREKNKNGVEEEDWIYGMPPLVTIITFSSSDPDGVVKRILNPDGTVIE